MTFAALDNASSEVPRSVLRWTYIAIRSGGAEQCEPGKSCGTWSGLARSPARVGRSVAMPATSLARGASSIRSGSWTRGLRDPGGRGQGCVRQAVDPAPLHTPCSPMFTPASSNTLPDSMAATEAGYLPGLAAIHTPLPRVGALERTVFPQVSAEGCSGPGADHG